jgi:hypothetical protein
VRPDDFKRVMLRPENLPLRTGSPTGGTFMLRAGTAPLLAKSGEPDETIVAGTRSIGHP